MGFDIEKIFASLKTGDVLMAYKGKITSEAVNSILDQIEKQLYEKNEDSVTIKKIYNVLVEGLQNLYHHIENETYEIKNMFGEKFGLFVITKIDNSYRISLGNFIDEEKKNFLTEKIEKINSLSREELKDLYKYILNHQQMSAKGGGGLGLVDIAKKTRNKLDYTYHHFNNNWYFYNLNVVIT